LRRPNTLERLIRSIKSTPGTLGREMAKWRAGSQKFWRVEDSQDFELREAGIKRLFLQPMRIARHHGKEIISIVH